MSVRAKFRVAEVNLRPSYDSSKPEPWANIVLSAVGDDGIPEHQRYHEATPSGSINLTGDKPKVERTRRSGLAREARQAAAAAKRQQEAADRASRVLFSVKCLRPTEVIE